MTEMKAQPKPKTKAQLNAAADLLEEIQSLASEARTRRGLSLRAAAEQIGMSWTTLHHVETGEHRPRADIAAKLLRWLAT